MPKGGARAGAGRKTKAEELGLSSLIDDVIGIDGKKDLIRIIHKQAKQGREASQKLLMEYIYGKPTEHHNIDQVTEFIIKYDGGINDLIKPIG